MIPNENVFGVRWPEWARRERPFELLAPLNLWELGVSRFGVFPEMQTFALRLLLRWRELQRRHRFDIVFDNQCLAWGLLGIRATGMPVVSVIHHPLHIDREADFAIDPRLRQEDEAHALLPAADAADRGAAARQDRDGQRGLAPARSSATSASPRRPSRSSTTAPTASCSVRSRARASRPICSSSGAPRTARRGSAPCSRRWRGFRARSRSRSSTAGFRTTGS